MFRKSVISILTILLIVMICPIGKSSAQSSDYSSVLKNIRPEYRADCERILNLAKNNWNDVELIKALETYPAGSMKHRAVSFLVAQMDKQEYVQYINPDDPLNPFSPEDKDIDWKREYIWDYQTVTADLLIEDVEWAFKARETFPWCKNLPEDIFFDYVLPYRSTQEPVVSWRKKLYEDLAPKVAGMKTALEVAKFINEYNTNRFHFDPLYYRHPEDNDIITLLDRGVGRCEDMSNVSNYCLRAVGVPTTSDFTPWWPKGDNNHAWNTVYYDGKWYQFMGCEAVETEVWDRIKSSTFAKVWRNSFSTDPIMGPSPDGTLPPRLMRTAAVDVTNEYTLVSDVKTPVDNPDLATYLCVYNYGAWRAVAGAWAKDGAVLFPKVGNNEILYCATRYIEDETGWGDNWPVASPFILHKNGSIEYVKTSPAEGPVGDLTLKGWNDSATLNPGEEVTLFRYVDSDLGSTPDAEPGPVMSWKPVGTVTAEDSDGTAVATFKNAAVDWGLFVLSNSSDPDSLKEGSRPFVWSDGTAIYY